MRSSLRAPRLWPCPSTCICRYEGLRVCACVCVRAQPCVGRRVYADTTDFVFNTVPEELGGNHVTFVRTVGVDGRTTVPDALSFLTYKPIRVYVAFRDDQHVPDWVDREYLTTPYRVVVDSPLRELTYVVFQSKNIVTAGECIPVVAEAFWP